MKMLILYYTWYKGNTKMIAKKLSDATSSDMEQIEPVRPYHGDYGAVMKKSQAEIEGRVQREIKPLSHSLSAYDIIAIGSPTWWFALPPAIRFLLNHYSFRGKTVVPFLTNGGFPGNALSDFESALQGSSILSPMEFQFDSAGKGLLVTKKEILEDWISSIRIALSEKKQG